MDEKDNKILDLLRYDASLTTRQIAKKTHIPITTVHNRIRRLREKGFIKRYTVEIDYEKVGRPLSVIILVSVDYTQLREIGKDQHELGDEIRRMPEVEEVSVVTGGTDLVVRVRVESVRAFDSFLLKRFQKIPGVDRTQSLVVIHDM